MKPWFTIRNYHPLNGPGLATEVLLYGTIGASWDGDGIEAKKFREEWDLIPKNSDITLRIHSPGGSVFDALVIYNTIAERRDKVTSVVDGLAASCASWIAMAAGKVKMPKTARMMIHNSHGLVIGDREEMRKMGDLLEREDERIADIYVAKTGKTRKAVQALMDATTWMDGKEAVEMGFADEATDAAAVKNDFDLSAFRRGPEPITTGPLNVAPEPVKIMNREQLIALLIANGVTVDNKLTDEQLAALLTTTLGDLHNKVTTNATAAAAASAAAAAKAKADAEAKSSVPDPTNTRIAALEARLETERVTRITNEVTGLCADRHLELKDWLPVCLANEATIANLAKLPIPQIPDPVPHGTGRVANAGPALVNKFKELKPGRERLLFTLDNYQGLRGFSLKEGKFRPQNVNTFDAALIPNIMSDAFIAVAQNVLAPLRYFTKEVNLNGMAPKVPVLVKRFTTGSAVVVNATNFQDAADSTLDGVLVTPNQLTKKFHVTNDQIQKGFRLDELEQGSAYIFANAISDVVTAIMIAANFPTPVVVGLSSAFDSADLGAIWAAGKNFPARNLILDGAYLSGILPQSQTDFRMGQTGAFGFDSISMQNRWTGAVANTVGFLGSPDAIMIASGPPVALPALLREVEVTDIVVDQLGIAAKMYVWADPSTRNVYGTYDIVIGAAPGDSSQGEILVSA